MAVAGQHDDPNALLAQRRERRGGALLDGVGDREEPGGDSVDRDHHDALPLAPQRIGMFGQPVRSDAERPEQRLVADREAPAVDRADHAA